MESDNKIKVSVVINFIPDKEDSEDQQIVMNQIKRMLTGSSNSNDEEDKDEILELLTATKLSQEIIADALIAAEREDLFDDKVESISSIGNLINKIKNYII